MPRGGLDNARPVIPKGPYSAQPLIHAANDLELLRSRPDSIHQGPRQQGRRIDGSNRTVRGATSRPLGFNPAIHPICGNRARRTPQPSGLEEEPFIYKGTP